ncbi:NAD(P)-binding protein [Massarina eburnea CBS 473.64]|uniref:NAD(P)-binding protein n=1 Tax=Massarina eburnea CBS 473.64 TaxID=1395130 RepID=A0A6A6S4P1_9PLEO|nr:NAD(P)-binding protein [Massarina eburnea CBS 473.64]
MAISNVALIGGTGTIGAPILEALKKSSFNTSVLNRQSSKSTYKDVNVITVPDDLNTPALASIFKDNSIDALIIAIKPSNVESQKKLINAALEAGVQRVMPADFGSCDSADAKTNELMPLMGRKKEIRDYLISLEGKGKLTWTSLITAHFFDWGLGGGLLRFDVRNRKAYIIDGGDIKFSASNLDFIAHAVIKVLQRPEETANKLLYIHGFYITQNELVAVLEKVTGDKFERISQNSEEEIAKEAPKVLAGDMEAYEELVAVWGIVAGDWSKRETFANNLLGLKEDNLEEAVRNVVQGLSA